MKNTLVSPASRTRSIATTIASGTFSTAMSSTSGSAFAVSAVKRPLPQPSSTRSSRAPGISSRQRPRCSSGRRIQQASHASIRGTRFFFLRIRMIVFLLKMRPVPHRFLSHLYHSPPPFVNGNFRFCA